MFSREPPSITQLQNPGEEFANQLYNYTMLGYVRPNFELKADKTALHMEYSGVSYQGLVFKVVMDPSMTHPWLISHIK